MEGWTWKDWVFHAIETLMELAVPVIGWVDYQVFGKHVKFYEKNDDGTYSRIDKWWWAGLSAWEIMFFLAGYALGVIGR